MREARHTVLPNTAYRGNFCPTTPATTSPLWIPIVICNRNTREIIAVMCSLQLQIIIVQPILTLLDSVYSEHAVLDGIFAKNCMKM